jgi:hypothetical protein
MRKTFYTPAGAVERDLTDAEVINFAKAGDQEAMLELARQAWANADTADKKIAVIVKLLRLIS